MNPFEKILERLKDAGGCDADCEYDKGWDSAIGEAISIVQKIEEESNNGWIPCSKELPPQPQENALLDNKPLELYMVCENVGVYPFRAFWNGKNFTDGFSKVDAIAWQPLPEPYQPKGE